MKTTKIDTWFKSTRVDIRTPGYQRISLHLWPRQWNWQVRPQWVIPGYIKRWAVGPFRLVVHLADVPELEVDEAFAKLP